MAFYTIAVFSKATVLVLFDVIFTLTMYVKLFNNMLITRNMLSKAQRTLHGFPSIRFLSKGHLLLGLKI